MDEIVKQAMVKWPNVPHCYGWLALDARGQWRMRDAAAQAQQLPGEAIRHSALLAFIARNYGCDERGYYYFQNGPQRVYVNLAVTPYILHTDGEGSLVDHIGDTWQRLDALWFSAEGQLIAQSGQKIGKLDDRDLNQCLDYFRLHDRALTEEDWATWLRDQTMPLRFCHGPHDLLVQYLTNASAAQLAEQFGYACTPSP